MTVNVSSKNLLFWFHIVTEVHKISGGEKKVKKLKVIDNVQTNSHKSKIHPITGHENSEGVQV
jgi:hypothetical protein